MVAAGLVCRLAALQTQDTYVRCVCCHCCCSVQVFETRVNGAHVHPPSSLSRFVVRDTGNASPRLLRSTLNVVPVSTDMLNNSGMQFALSVQPLALPDPEDDPVVVSTWQAESTRHPVQRLCSSKQYIAAASDAQKRVTHRHGTAHGCRPPGQHTPDLLACVGPDVSARVVPVPAPCPPWQVVDLGELGPVRCGRCKAYMNPYMRWTDGGKTYVCNFCGQANPCPDVYFNYLGPDNRLVGPAGGRAWGLCSLGRSLAYLSRTEVSAECMSMPATGEGMDLQHAVQRPPSAPHQPLRPTTRARAAAAGVVTCMSVLS